MTVIARDAFGGFVAPPTSGSAPFTAVDNTVVNLWMEFRGTATTGDQLDYTLTFPTGTVTFRARWTSSTTLVLERVSTIPGTNNGTATLQTFTGASTNKPRSDGDLVRLSITVNRGAADALTALTFAWHGRSAFATIGTTNTFNVDGELTPTAGAFAVTGTSFRDRPNLEGRTPDGDGTPALAVGTWALTLGNPGFEQWGVTSEGIAQPCLPVNNDMAYACTGTGAGGDQAVRAWATVTAGTAPILALLARWNPATQSGYAAFMFFPAFPELYRVDNGVFTQLDIATTADLDDDVEHEYELSTIGDAIRFLVDSVEAMSATDATYTTGDPGLGGLRDSRATSGMDVTAWEVDSEGAAPPPNPCAPGIASQDEFTGAAVADIDGRALVDFPAGTWARDPASSGAIGIDGAGVARKTGAGRAFYRDTGIPDLGNDYCAEAVIRFPSVESAGTPGVTPYFEPWRYRVYDNSSVGGAVLAEGLVTDLVGTQTIGGLLIENLTVWPNSQPKTFTIKNTNVWGGAGGPSGPARAIRFFTRAHPGGGMHTYPIVVDWLMTEDPEVQDDSFGNMGGKYLVNNTPESPTTSQIPLGPQNVLPDHPYPPFYFPLGNPATDTRTVSTSATTPIIEWTIGGGGQSGKYDVAIAEMELDGTTAWDVGIPGSHVLEHAYAEALVRLDATADTGYGLRLDFDHTSGSIVALARLYERSAGVETRCRSSTRSVAHGVDQTITLRVADVGGLPVLVALHNAEILFVFEVATDLADETSAVVATHSTGDPGLAALDDSGTGDYLEIERFTVYGPVPCEGGEDNPYPWDPPPPGPSPALEWNGYYRYQNGLARQICHEWLMQNGVYHKVIGPEIPPEEIRRYFQEIGVPRASLSLCTDFDGETVPEPDTPLPPFYDPCLLVPTIDPGPTIPITGRFFGMSNTPMGAMGPLFTGTQTALGSYFLTTLIPQAVAKGVTLLGAQGGGSRVKLNGTTWDLDFFLAGTRAIIAPLYTGLIAAGPAFFGYSAADDVTSQDQWGLPGGIPMPELAFAIATLKAEFPGIRFGTRMRPSQVAFNPGLDFYYCQYSAERGDAGSFAASEYSICLARNAYLVVCLNYLHGGNGSSGVRYQNGTHKGQSAHNWMCSPTEVATYIPAMLNACVAMDGTGAKVPGVLGYQYLPEFLALVDANYTMIEAMVIAHNAVAAMPPIPS